MTTAIVTKDGAYVESRVVDGRGNVVSDNDLKAEVTEEHVFVILGSSGLTSALKKHFLTAFKHAAQRLNPEPFPELVVEEMPDSAALLVCDRATGQWASYSSMGEGGRIYPQYEILPGFYGSGGDLARGAYAICKEPVEAMRAAIECNVESGGVIRYCSPVTGEITPVG